MISIPSRTSKPHLSALPGRTLTSVSPKPRPKTAISWEDLSDKGDAIISETEIYKSTRHCSHCCWPPTPLKFPQLTGLVSNPVATPSVMQVYCAPVSNRARKYGCLEKSVRSVASEGWDFVTWQANIIWLFTILFVKQGIMRLITLVSLRVTFL